MALDDVAVRREVILPVDRKRAWQALEDPQELAHWLADEVDLEVRPGARGWISWGDGERRTVIVDEVVAHRRLVLRWSAPDGPDSVVELVLDDVPEGTRLVVVELPMTQLEAVGDLLDRGPGAFGPPASATGPQMVAALA